MVHLEEISKIGVGTYRMTNNSKENQEALFYAIKIGCNLIDTASNYENGNSEKLVGDALKHFKNKNLFVVTKAGYVSGENLKVLNTAILKSKSSIDIVEISPFFKHSIHPIYLKEQLKVSLERLNTKVIDGFLLHSPEYYFEQKSIQPTQDVYYERIYKAFEFLEEMVKEGLIRYYGISSNTLTLNKIKYNSTELPRLIALANKITANHHFKLLQFPYNLIENEATQLVNTNGLNLIQYAKSIGLTVFSNRPLNANYNSGLMRLILHDNHEHDSDIIRDTAVCNESFKLIEKQLKNHQGNKLADFPMLVYLKENWINISNEKVYRRLFDEYFLPFIQLTFSNNIPDEIMHKFKSFQEASWKYYKINSNTKVIEYLKCFGFEDLIPSSRLESLPVNISNFYLKEGIDHVLVGLRKIQYVKQFKNQF